MSSEQLHGTQVPPQRAPFQQPSWPVPGPPLDAAPHVTGSRRWRRRFGLPVAFLLVFLLGVGVGGGDTTLEQERDEAREQLTAAESQILTLQGQADEAASLEQRLTAAQSEVTRLRGEAATSASTSAQLTSDLQGAQAEAARLDDEVSRLQGELAAAEAQTQASPATAPSNLQTPSSTSSGPARSSVPSSASYANCSAARAAGVAPLRRGDAGYASKLDRDGDGIACE